MRSDQTYNTKCDVMSIISPLWTTSNHLKSELKSFLKANLFSTLNDFFFFFFLFFILAQIYEAVSLLLELQNLSSLELNW